MLSVLKPGPLQRWINHHLPHLQPLMLPEQRFKDYSSMLLSDISMIIGSAAGDARERPTTDWYFMDLRVP